MVNEELAGRKARLRQTEEMSWQGAEGRLRR
jgi:hypothetical protein